MKVLLEILEYGGLLLATISSAWGLLHETTRKKGSGWNRLTGPGRVAFCLIVGGLLVSVASRLVKSRVASIEAQQRVDEDRMRSFRLAASSQPMQSIRIKWVFDGLTPDVVRELEAGFARVKSTIENDDDHKYQSDPDRNFWLRSLDRAEVVYPWFSFLATGKWTSKPYVVIRLPIYESEAVVLPLGCLPW